MLMWVAEQTGVDFSTSHRVRFAKEFLYQKIKNEYLTPEQTREAAQ